MRFLAFLLRALASVFVTTVGFRKKLPLRFAVPLPRVRQRAADCRRTSSDVEQAANASARSRALLMLCPLIFFAAPLWEWVSMATARSTTARTS